MNTANDDTMPSNKHMQSNPLMRAFSVCLKLAIIRR